MNDEFDPLTGDPLPKSNKVAPTATQPPANAITAEEIARLEGMDKESLIALIRRFACQCGIATMMTKEETAQAMRDVLAETALKPIVAGLNMKADINARMTAIDKWLDRSEGKAAQIVSMSVTGSVENKIMLPATRAFLDSFIDTVVIDQ